MRAGTNRSFSATKRSPATWNSSATAASSAAVSGWPLGLVMTTSPDGLYSIFANDCPFSVTSRLPVIVAVLPDTVTVKVPFASTVSLPIVTR